MSEDKIVLPNGKESDYLLYDNLPDSVCIVAINNNDQLLLNNEYCYPVNEYISGFPAGIVESGEEPIETARRELQEETGFTAKNMKKLGEVLYNHRRSSALYHFFLATELNESKLMKDDEEIIESSWINISEFQKLVANGKIKHLGTIAAWGMYLNSINFND